MKHDKQNLEALIFHFPSENTFLCVTSSGAGLFCFFFSTDFDEQHKIEISIHFIRCLLHRAEPHCRPELMHPNVTIQISWKMICISSGRSQETPQVNNNTSHPRRSLSLYQPLLSPPLLWMRKWQSRQLGWQSKWCWQQCSTQEAHYF